jgi:hypothetical protein
MILALPMGWLNPWGYLPLAKWTLEQYQRFVKLELGELDKSGIAKLILKVRCSRQ